MLIDKADTEMMSARTVILDLFDTGDPADFSVAELVRAGAALGIEAPGIRTALTRLKAEGRVRPIARGRYAIGPKAEPLKQRILRWRTRLSSRVEWQGHWLLAIAGPQERADRTAWRRTLRALELEGFAEAETNVWARPDNLVAGADAARSRLANLESVSSLLVIEAREVDKDRVERYRSLWQGEALCAAHLSLAEHLDQSAVVVESMDLPAAAAETLQLGRRAIRQITRDPLLPEALCPSDGLQSLIEAMVRYDRIGKQIWRAYLAQ